MNTYHKVTSKVYNNRVVASYSGEVKAEQRPESTCKRGVLYDLYEDYFDTIEKARRFAAIAKKA